MLNSNIVCHQTAHEQPSMLTGAGHSNIRTVRDLPLTSIAEEHAVVDSLNGTPIQLRTLGRSIARCILLEHMTRNEIYIERNHGNVRDANRFRKTI